MENSDEQKLIDYQKKISNILESFTDAFFEVDEHWIVTYWNKEAERLLNKPRSEIIGKNLWEVYEEAIPLKFYAEYHRAVEHNISVRFEEYFPPFDLWIEVAAFPSGSGLSVYFKDITKGKRAMQQLLEERQKYRDLFNFSPVPQWVFDMDSLEFLDVNEAAILHYGYSREEFLSMSISEIRPLEDVATLRQVIDQKIVPGAAHKIHSRHQKKNGEVIHVYVEGNSINFEGKNARLVMVIDRTVELQSQHKLSEISWIQSHKVRAPLSRILGLAELINLEHADKREQKQFVTYIYAAARELDQVIEEIVKKT